MSFIKKLSVFSVLSLFALSVLAVPFGVAQDQSGSGLQISPTRTEIEGDPGTSKEFSITLKNVTQADVYAKAFINDFQSDGVTGNPQLITDENQKSPFSIRDMLTGLQDVELKPGESKTLNLAVNIPSTATPGAYFGAVRYAAVPRGQADQSDTQQVALTASVAHLVFVNVPGDVREQIEVQNLKISRDDKTTGIFFSAPNKSAITIKNLGNGFSRPFGTITIFNSSNKEISRQDVNPTTPKGIVLPNSTRVFDNKVEGVDRPGKYKAVASVAYGNGGEVVTFEKSFWYLPLWFLGVIALVIILLIVAGVVVYKKYVAKKFGK